MLDDNRRFIMTYTLRSAERAARVFHDEPSMSSKTFKSPIHDWHAHVLISANYIWNDSGFNNDARDPFVHSNFLCIHYRSMLLQKAQSLSSLLSIKQATSKSEVGYKEYINIMKYGHIFFFFKNMKHWIQASDWLKTYTISEMQFKQLL